MERVPMRSRKAWMVLMACFVLASTPRAFAQSAKPTADPAPQKAATEEEVQQLRKEVAELKAQIQQLIQTSARSQAGSAHLVQANAVADSVQPDLSASPATAPADAHLININANLSQPAA